MNEADYKVVSDIVSKFKLNRIKMKVVNNEENLLMVLLSNQCVQSTLKYLSITKCNVSKCQPILSLCSNWKLIENIIIQCYVIGADTCKKEIEQAKKEIRLNCKNIETLSIDVMY